MNARTGVAPLFDDPLTDLPRHIAARAGELGLTIGVAESLTAGRIAGALGAAPEASEWFRGSVVAYASEVKFDVLGVTPGPVNCDSCAREMAAGARRLLGADLAISATGVGGPGPDEGVPAGTVHVAVATADLLESHELHLTGNPREVIDATVVACLRLAAHVLDAAPGAAAEETR